MNFWDEKLGKVLQAKAEVGLKKSQNNLTFFIWNSFTI